MATIARLPDRACASSKLSSRLPSASLSPSSRLPAAGGKRLACVRRFLEDGPRLLRPPVSVIPSGATRFSLPRRIVARRVAQSRDLSSPPFSLLVYPERPNRRATDH